MKRKELGFYDKGLMAVYMKQNFFKKSKIYFIKTVLNPLF
jgi:hypothetical protein